MDPDCRDIRTNILTCAHTSGYGHIPTSFSVVELIYSVYARMRHDPKNPDWNERDLFILSKGHAALGLYCVMAHYGYFPPEDLRTFGNFMSRYGCHADRLKVPGIEVSTGSLGHGIGVAVGAALAFTLDNLPRKVYTLIGDGESNEGSVWEAIMVATNVGLKNLTILYDYNLSQVRSLQIHNPAERFRAFGCEVTEVDGHENREIQAALDKPCDVVRVIVARTIKGYGCSTLSENIFEWHRKSPDKQQLSELLEELDEGVCVSSLKRQ
jgi:transketolase